MGQRHGKTEAGHDSLERQRALRDVIPIKTSPVTIRNYYTDTLRRRVTITCEEVEKEEELYC